MKIAVAYIKGPRGLKGEMTAVLHRPSSTSLRPGLPVVLARDGRELATTVEFVKSLRRGIGIKLAGINDEQTASGWKGGDILVEESELEPLDDMEFYHFQIEGAEVFEAGGEKVGTVKGIESSTGHEIMVVETSAGEIMIPFAKAIVKSVDVDRKKIVIEKIEGLY